MNRETKGSLVSTRPLTRDSMELKRVLNTQSTIMKDHIIETPHNIGAKIKREVMHHKKLNHLPS